MIRAPADVGAPVEAVDTPALLVELDAYERNLDRMAQSFRGTTLSLRPHAKTHKSPIIARHQIARGAVGVCCQKVSEAEVMVEGGVRDVLVTNQVIGAAKVGRLVALAKQATVAACVDDADNVRQLGDAARAVGIQLPILVEVNVGGDRCGVLPGERAVALAEMVAAQPGLRFRGLQAYQGRAQHIEHIEQRRAAVQRAIEAVARTLDLLRRSRLDCEVVSGAGTGTFQFESGSGLYTEIQAGSYVFMDAHYKRVEGFPSAFENALFVLTTVMSRPAPDRVVVDAGLKAVAVDSGMPVVRGAVEALEYRRASDEHGVLVVQGSGPAPRVGDRLDLIPGHCDPTVNLYDWYVGVRGGRVEAIWPVAARGAVL